MAADDFRLSHKTSLRDVYDIARHESGAAEVVFVDEPGFVTEGSWSNIFVERDGQLLTPPLALGLLPGVLRAELIDKGRAVESHLRIEIGRAHVCTPVTNAHLVCRLLLENKK